MKHITVLLAISLILLPIAGCGSANERLNSPDISPASENTATVQPADETDENVSQTPDTRGKRAINAYFFDDYEIIYRYQELHPDFPYRIMIYSFSTTDGNYYVALDEGLREGGKYIPDIYAVESSYVEKYARGDMAQYAVPYRDLGIDVDTLIKEADIYQYVIDMGTNSDGQVVALGYQGTGGAFIYRRSIAKSVWGTDNPEIIKNKIGPGWDRFLKAAEELKKKGYAIVSGYDDVLHPMMASAENPWVIDGKLIIGPDREAFFDVAKQLHDNGYTNNTETWTEDWYNGMKDAGPKKVFGYFGASWTVSYVIRYNCGGEKPGEGTYGDWAVCEPPAGFFWTGIWIFVNKNSEYKEAVADLIRWITLDSSEEGLQYSWASGTYPANKSVKDAVVSGKIMRKVSCESDILGGQNMFKVFDRAARLANGKNATQYDESINTYWLGAAREYVEGKKTREQAILDFKNQVKEQLGIAAD